MQLTALKVAKSAHRLEDNSNLAALPVGSFNVQRGGEFNRALMDEFSGDHRLSLTKEKAFR